MIPVVALEAYLHVEIDQTYASRHVGSLAVLNVKVMKGYQATLANQTNLTLLNGTRVRIEDDSEDTLIGVIPTNEGYQRVDFRSVKVTLLDGEATGKTIWVAHCSLQLIYENPNISSAANSL